MITTTTVIKILGKHMNPRLQTIKEKDKLKKIDNDIQSKQKINTPS